MLQFQFQFQFLFLPARAQDPCTPQCQVADDLALAIEATELAGKGPAQPFFAPYDDVEEEVLRLLDGARDEVIIAHYNIRRERVLEKLAQLHERGVTVRVVVGGQEGSHEQVSTLRVVLQNDNELVSAFPVTP